MFLCTSFTGTPKCDEKEMKLASFITLEELLENRDKMFKPFLDSLEVLENYRKKMIDTVSTSAIMKLPDSQADGGPGSGNFGHEGVKGQQGGSAPQGSTSRNKPHVKSGKKPTLKLPSKEYGKVMHEIDTYFHRRFEDRKGKTCLIEVGKFAYVFDNKGYNTYNIHRKIKIEGNENLIKKLKEIYE